MAEQTLSVISLFSGALGLDLGLESAGFSPRVCVEVEKVFCDTIRLNRPNIPVLQGDIRSITATEILATAGLEPGEAFLVSGGPPCQPFSTAGRRQSVQDPRGSLFMDFVRIVDEARPRYFVMENVRGILSAAIRHRPINERGAEFGPLEPDEMSGSALRIILAEFDRIGYTVTYGLLNALNFGVPQSRERVVFLGSRDGKRLPLPKATHAESPSAADAQRWRTLGDALHDLVDEKPQYRPYGEKRARFFRLIPPGQGWRALPKELQPIALGGAFKSGGGKMGFYRRLSFDKHSPTVVTSPDQLATSMCHPTEVRPLSVRECARIQEFPDNWEFAGNMVQQYRQIGNAVPVGLGRAIANHLLKVVEGGLEGEEELSLPLQIALPFVAD